MRESVYFYHTTLTSTQDLAFTHAYCGLPRTYDLNPTSYLRAKKPSDLKVRARASSLAICLQITLMVRLSLLSRALPCLEKKLKDLACENSHIRVAGSSSQEDLEGMLLFFHWS